MRARLAAAASAVGDGVDEADLIRSSACGIGGDRGPGPSSRTMVIPST